MIKIRRSEDNGLVVFALSGRIEEKDVPELEELLQAEAEGLEIALELGEVRLVDRGAVRFLAACEAQRIKLNNCPSYIREWIRTGSNN
jgi:hypothetical protein